MNFFSDKWEVNVVNVTIAGLIFFMVIMAGIGLANEKKDSELSKTRWKVYNSLVIIISIMFIVYVGYNTYNNKKTPVFKRNGLFSRG